MSDIVERIDDLLSEMSARKVMKVLKKKGCKTLRQKGSHIQVQCPPDGKQSTVPSHGSGDIKKGTLSGIEKSLNIDIDGDGKPKESLDEASMSPKVRRVLAYIARTGPVPHKSVLADLGKEAVSILAELKRDGLVRPLVGTWSITGKGRDA